MKICHWKMSLGIYIHRYPLSYPLCPNQRGSSLLSSEVNQLNYIYPHLTSHFIFPDSFWKIFQMSYVLTSPCTWTRRSYSCPFLSVPAGAASGLCLCTSRPPSVPQGNICYAKGMPCRPSTLYAPAPWKSSKTAWCWRFLVSLNGKVSVKFHSEAWIKEIKCGEKAW